MKIVLSTELLLAAYSHGYFPMPHPDTEEICWFHPDPRAIIPLPDFHVSRSLRKTMRHFPFRISYDEAFPAVIDGCAERPETWINDEIREAFTRLHEQGHAHSVEVWLDAELVGGTYGLGIGGAFFAESMFHRVTDASKVALYGLVQNMQKQGYKLLEVQFLTPHLRSLGAIEIPASDYMTRLQDALLQRCRFLGPGIMVDTP